MLLQVCRDVTHFSNMIFVFVTLFFDISEDIVSIVRKILSVLYAVFVLYEEKDVKFIALKRQLLISNY